MKKYRFIYLVLFVFLLFSCEENNFMSPEAGFEIMENDVALSKPYTLQMGVEYEFKSTSAGDGQSFWFGIPGESDYNKRGVDNANTGIPALKRKNFIVDYAYDTTGTYEVVIVAASYNFYEDRYEEDVEKETVIVIE